MKRAYTYLLQERLKTVSCVVVTGPGRCGKTAILENLSDEWRRFDLERTRDYQAISRDPALFLRLHPGRIIIEHAECLPELFPALNSALAEGPLEAGRFILTVNGTPDCIPGFSDIVSGRTGFVEMAPLAWSETHRLKSWPSFVMLLCDSARSAADFMNLRPRDTLEAVHAYWLTGGYPEPGQRKTRNARAAWMDRYLMDYASRDIARYFPGLDHNRFSLFVRMLAGLSGTLINYSEVARVLEVSAPTARDYFDVADSTFLWRKIPPFEKSASKRIVRHPKGQMRDTGLLHHLLRIQDPESLLGHPQVERSWKGMVIEEILRQLLCRGAAFSYCHYRTSAGAEVDLVLEGEFGLVPIRIVHTQAVGWRQMRPLQDFVNEFGCRLGILIDGAPAPRLPAGNIVAVPFSHI